MTAMLCVPFFGEETTVRDEFVHSLRAAITNANTYPPKSWNDIHDDMSGFPVDCNGARYVEEEEEKEEAQPQQNVDADKHTPKKKAKTALAKTPNKNSSPQSTQATPLSTLGNAVPTGPGMGTFLAHFSPSRCTLIESQALGNANVKPKPTLEKAHACGMCKRRVYFHSLSLCRLAEILASLSICMPLCTCSSTVYDEFCVLRSIKSIYACN